jgi:outer membrane lipoprotein-sorting protein
MKKTILLLLLVAFTISGCATFNKIVTNNALVTQLAVEAATARVLHEHLDWKGKTISITETVISAIDNKTMTDLGSIELFIPSQISWRSLTPEEQALISVLISQAKQNLLDSYRAQHIENPLAQLVQVRQMLTWIHDAAARQ